MEVEEVFLQLWGEVARLRELCSEQGRLLRRLRARKGPVLDIPVSLPIQCTEGADAGDGPRSPESRQNHPGAPTSHTSHLDQPMEQPQAASRFSPSPGSSAGTGGTAALGSTEGEKGDFPSWMRPWILSVPWGGGGAPCSPRELEMLNPGPGGSSPNPLDLSEAPEVPEREGAPRDVALPGEALVEIRGPVKTCWTPGWALEEETLGPEAAAGCDLCQEILPSDTAGYAEYLSHLLAHLE
ncbi:collagen alpha-4(IV) chain-like [Prinia subflava]|uniref:collagen alpha-4(IV) chain-like n=1 Tax=Prinia subflava TaxID=208062 RepID=UPI002FE0D2C6